VPVGKTGRLMTTIPLQDYENVVRQHAEEVLAPVRDLAGRLGVACDTVHVPNKHPAEAIVEHAKARSCDLIVMASHGRRGLAKILLGKPGHQGAGIQRGTGADLQVKSVAEHQ
jgi:nucleotide-binding universal stress UspA family protein